jgi:hypothetical protein
MSRTGSVSTELFGRSLPVNQWIGASKCVPVCSPKGQVVPVPGRTTRVVARNLLDAHRRSLAELGRQHDDREVRAERERQIDDAHRAGCDRAG